MTVPDHWIIQKALSRKWISPQQVAEISRLRQQNESSISRWIVEKGYLKREQLWEIEQETVTTGLASEGEKTVDLPCLAQNEAESEGEKTVDLPQFIEKPSPQNTAGGNLQETVDIPPETPIPDTVAEIDPWQKEEPAENFGSRYKVIRELGHGQFGCVYLVEDTHLGRKVALKSLQLTSGEAIQRFFNEAQAIAGLRHPNIITLYEIQKEKKPYFFTMDYIEGNSLDRLLKQRGKPLGMSKTCSIIRQVAQALHYAHERSVIHRDIKPGNIMLDHNEIPYVMDFGLVLNVKDSQRLTRDGAVMGTLSYMPPEQVQGRIRDVDRRSDVYSLGATLYELLIGCPPFPGVFNLSTMERIAHDPPTPLRKIRKKIPQTLENICLRCLEKEREKRYQSAGELARDLEKFLNREQLDNQPRRKLPWPAVALAATMLFLLGIWGLWPSDKIEPQKQPKARLPVRTTPDNPKIPEDSAAREEELKKLQLQNEALGTFLGWKDMLDKNKLPADLDTESRIEQSFPKLREHLPAIHHSNSLVVWGKAYLLLLKQKETPAGEREKLLQRALDKFYEITQPKQPGNEEVAILGYQSSFLFSDIAKAQESASKFLAYFPDNDDNNPYVLYRKACKHIYDPQSDENKPQEYAKANQYLDQIIQKQPNFAEAYIEQGVLARKDEKYETAQARLQLALSYLKETPSSHPNYLRTYLELAEVHNDWGKKETKIPTLFESGQKYYEKAEQYYDLVLHEDPHFISAHYGKATLYQNWAEAAEKAELLKLINKGKATEYWEKAYDCAQEVLDSNPPESRREKCQKIQKRAHKRQ